MVESPTLESPDSRMHDPIFDKFTEDSEGRSSGDTSTTPNSEISPPDSPAIKNAGLSKADVNRAKSRSLAASLSLEEQVRLFHSYMRAFSWPCLTSIGLTSYSSRLLEVKSYSREGNSGF